MLRIETAERAARNTPRAGRQRHTPATSSDAADTWDDGLIARRVSETSPAEQPAAVEIRTGGLEQPATPCSSTTTPCAPGSTRCANWWGSPAPGSTARRSPRPAVSWTRRRHGAGSPGSTPSSRSPAPPAAASHSCSTRSPAWPSRRWRTTADDRRAHRVQLERRRVDYRPPRHPGPAAPAPRAERGGGGPAARAHPDRPARPRLGGRAAPRAGRPRAGARRRRHLGRRSRKVRRRRAPRTLSAAHGGPRGGHVRRPQPGRPAARRGGRTRSSTTCGGCSTRTASPSAKPGRSNGDHRRPQDIRRRRDPRRQRGPDGLGGPVRDVRRGRGTRRPTASTSTTPRRRTPSTTRRRGAAPRWASTRTPGRIRWILQNSYPQVNDLATLAKKAGIVGGLTEQDAAAGTQVAIWRYSDGADVDAVDPQAERLADYLQNSARDVAEPRALLHPRRGGGLLAARANWLGPVDGTHRRDPAAGTS
ncbi:hypothetical protein SAURM35S_09756 [Streptomyces aurantiogriseus]